MKAQTQARAKRDFDQSSNQLTASTAGELMQGRRFQLNRRIQYKFFLAWDAGKGTGKGTQDAGRGTSSGGHRTQDAAGRTWNRRRKRADAGRRTKGQGTYLHTYTYMHVCLYLYLYLHIYIYIHTYGCGHTYPPLRAGGVTGSVMRRSPMPKEKKHGRDCYARVALAGSGRIYRHRLKEEWA